MSDRSVSQQVTDVIGTDDWVIVSTTPEARMITADALVEMEAWPIGIVLPPTSTGEEEKR